ncbi:cytochrome c5 family protein [Pseudomonas sp. HAR-UPW-AIA-41]|jgi:cytochrome c5|uniref:c-type cytochrome n=1 Tax=Pseudomonas sp. HAR-UPW-AIA-41 TaxID=1985301 RepID=UPI000BB3749A|nr:cytochrome c5 family protein [Pseudomonas sp. HAR-UPW-AIA-41]PAV47355.1 cytochrome c5 family protein [Pseudomonas sp. HAR-UPW-AIA-41]
MKKLLLAASMLVLSAGVQAAQDPEAVFNRACGVCHNGQLPMAPKKGDAAAWEPRLKQGMDTLVQHVTNGFNAMPPRGMCMDCTAEDYKATIEWMSK